MTVSDAIERAEDIYKYSGSSERLIQWLSELEEKINIELFGVQMTVKLDTADTLTAPDAYAEFYPLYLVMKSTFTEGKTETYNNMARCFERAYSEYVDHVNRNHVPEKTVYYKIL